MCVGAGDERERVCYVANCKIYFLLRVPVKNAKSPGIECVNDVPVLEACECQTGFEP